MKKVISIDPGVSGGIAVFIDGNLHELHTIPKVKTVVDYNELSSLWERIIDKDSTIIIEEVHSIFGSSAKSNFSFGKICGFLLGLIVSSKLPYVLVQPKKWQKDIWVTQDKVYKTGTVKKTVDTKATSLLAAKRLFPNTDFRKSSRAKKFHDGLIDAALVGKWFIYGLNRNI